MQYLSNYGFSSDEINELEETIPSKLKEKFTENYKLVSENINYIKDLGVKNYKDIFSKYYDIFLMDNSNFKDIFQKYDTADLIEKLEKNMEIIEFL